MAIFTADRLASMRATVEATFGDACTINQPDEKPTLDPDTGEYSDGTAGAEVYAGPCAVAPTQGTEQVVIVAGEPVTLRTFLVRLPWDTEGLKVDQIVTLDTDDPYLDTRRLRVVDVQGRTTPLERVLIAEDNLR